jgi:hypothetical protein
MSRRRGRKHGPPRRPRRPHGLRHAWQPSLDIDMSKMDAIMKEAVMPLIMRDLNEPSRIMRILEEQRGKQKWSPPVGRRRV